MKKNLPLNSNCGNYCFLRLKIHNIFFSCEGERIFRAEIL
jgi:hypothetical protein